MTEQPTQKPAPPSVRPGVQILCGKCGQLLALSLGDRLDCFAFTVDHRVNMTCEACRYVTKWGPDRKKAR